MAFLPISKNIRYSTFGIWYIPSERFLDPPPLLSILYMGHLTGSFLTQPNPWPQRSAS